MHEIIQIGMDISVLAVSMTTKYNTYERYLMYFHKTIGMVHPNVDQLRKDRLIG